MTDDGDARGTIRKLAGVGNGTAEVLLTWTLGRQDVQAVDDLHLRKAMASR